MLNFYLWLLDMSWLLKSHVLLLEVKHRKVLFRRFLFTYLSSLFLFLCCSLPKKNRELFIMRCFLWFYSCLFPTESLFLVPNAQPCLSDAELWFFWWLATRCRVSFSLQQRRTVAFIHHDCPTSSFSSFALDSRGVSFKRSNFIE